MNKFALYILLILIFLGLSKSFDPTEKGTPFIPNNRVYANFFPGAPLSLILVDSYKSGFLIKTYFQKFKIIYAFKPPEFIIVRTGQKNWKNNLKYLGMSVFRREEKEGRESITPLPPGSLFVGDPAYGRWRMHDSGIRRWHFHRAYRHFPSIFGWGNWRPSKEFHKTKIIHDDTEKAFFGLNSEFGLGGSISDVSFPHQHNFMAKQIGDFKTFIKKYTWIPPWTSEDKGFSNE